MNKVKICVVVFTTCYKYYGLLTDKLNKMTKEQLRLRMLSEDPEEAQLLSNRLEQDLKEAQEEQEERNEMNDILIAYLGQEDFNDIQHIIEGVQDAIFEYTNNKIIEYKKCR